MYQYRKTRKRYLGFPKATECDFCEDDGTKSKAVLVTKHAMVIPNRVFYDVWESHKVLDHLLVVPKRHVHSLSELTDEELLDIMHICADYEGKHYNVYARATASVRRSVFHQHTHLIKIGPRQAKASLFIGKPYFFWTKF